MVGCILCAPSLPVAGKVEPMLPSNRHHPSDKQIHKISQGVAGDITLFVL